MSELEQPTAGIGRRDGDLDAQVLIVGAGPTELVLACDLTRRGRLRILDKAPAPFAGSRGKGLQPRSLEVLDDPGVVERVLASGVSHLPFRGWQGNRVIRPDGALMSRCGSTRTTAAAASPRR
jgi:2-polyprenyl-6-methoxyphenol hydroxylase-like FAD-dependent oxidoreductase